MFFFVNFIPFDLDLDTDPGGLYQCGSILILIRNFQIDDET
jgi:hypothetical protein